MKNLVLLQLFAGTMVLLLVVSGCSRRVTSSITKQVSDSVFVKEVPRFIPINIPGDTVILERVIECDPVTNKPKPFDVKKKSKQATLIVTVDNNGKLNATSICDSLRKVVEAKDREISRYRSEKTQVEIPVYKTSEFDIFCRWWFAISVLIIIVTIFLKLKNF